ncbi:MAG: hypothetical protein J4G09_13415 [Proteobacteria bacterium]|nr:hypothetical protein [Pseudomonadota bacterium]
MGEIRGAFVGLIRTPDPESARAYDDWHATDHLAENWALPQVVFASRWWATPEQIAGRRVGEAALAAPQFLISYFFRDPLDAAIEDFVALGNRLVAAGRGFAEREVVFGRYFELESARLAAGVELSPEALPYRRHRGVVLELGEADDSSGPAALHDAAGVLGCLRFVARPGPVHDACGVGRARADLYFADRPPGELLAAEAGRPRPGTALLGAFDPTD